MTESQAHVNNVFYNFAAYSMPRSVTAQGKIAFNIRSSLFEWYSVMNDNSAPEYGRLLKRSTVREEIVLKADHKLDITRCRSCYEHSRSSRICKSSVARPNLYSLRETQVFIVATH